MKHTSRRLLSLLMIGGLIGSVLSCGTFGKDLADAFDVGAQGTAQAGYISQETADRISKTGYAFSRLEDITPEQEYFIGRAVGANILTQYQFCTHDPALTAYINHIIQTVVVNSPNPELYNGYHGAVLDTTEINAFATSGGHIFLTHGIIDCADSEDAIAAIVAHEIAHIQLQHNIKAIKASRYTEVITSVMELTTLFDESVSDIVTTMINDGYSQEQEFEADTLALSLLASAGYEPSSLIDMLRVLEKNQAAHSGGFNKTHPSPTDRIANANKAVGSYTATDTRSFRQARFTAELR
ncbi:peptidase M48 [Spirochaetia bacterium]|nr:peptidase M48 [Spirochaetia bacterium]